MNIAMILAGGIGNRFGAKIPKQFVLVHGVPVLAYTIEAFEHHPSIDSILVVCLETYISYIWELKDKYKLNKIKWVTKGGDTFQRSVMSGIQYLEGKINADDIVLIHFGASPFVTDDIISDAIRVCQKTGNAISATDYYLLSGKKKSTSSVSEPGNYSEEYINRDTIAVMNTPHAFQYKFISDMYKDAVETGIIETVEPHTTTLMYAMGKKIYFSYGKQNNIKITRKEDLELFEGYVLEQQKKRSALTTGDVIVFLADGFEECEALLVVDLLRRAGIKTIMASITGTRDVKSSRDIVVQSDCLAEHADYDNAALLFLPGGRLGVDNLNNHELVKEQCIKFAKDRYIAAICSAPMILASLGLLDGKKASVNPDYKNKMKNAITGSKKITIDGKIITGQGLGITIPFALEMIKILKSEMDAQRIAKEICY